MKTTAITAYDLLRTLDQHSHKKTGHCKDRSNNMKRYSFKMALRSPKPDMVSTKTRKQTTAVSGLLALLSVPSSLNIMNLSQWLSYLDCFVSYTTVLLHPSPPPLLPSPSLPCSVHGCVSRIGADISHIYPA